MFHNENKIDILKMFRRDNGNINGLLLAGVSGMAIGAIVGASLMGTLFTPAATVMGALVGVIVGAPIGALIYGGLYFKTKYEIDNKIIDETTSSSDKSIHESFENSTPKPTQTVSPHAEEDKIETILTRKIDDFISGKSIEETFYEAYDYLCSFSLFTPNKVDSNQPPIEPSNNNNNPNNKK